MTARGLPEAIKKRLTLPLIAAPMLRVSGPDLVVAACNAGVIGAFPTKNARTVDELDAWLFEMESRNEANAAPLCPNLIMRDARLEEDLSCIVRHRCEMVITSVGSPARAVSALHDVGCLVLADVATVHHAERALEADVDGLILLTAGAGGQTGWLNPFAYVRAVRSLTDKLVVLAGGISDGHALRAAIALGCDLAYMGTKLIATRESMASDAYRDMLLASSMDDVMSGAPYTLSGATMGKRYSMPPRCNPNSLAISSTSSGEKQYEWRLAIFPSSSSKRMTA
jgi:nitronate monooxygenase